ncbi:hypothetical protein K438DRAFT_1775829 [Mycena galopus ATCC 62051]|nr:hypothetical protein K438DRAFT_1775829 [Mycena galopus ATCC 62051]
MVRPAFGFLALALAIAHPRYVTALPGLVTVPLLGNPSQTHSFTAVQLGVDSQSGYTTYGIEAGVVEGGPSGNTTLPYTATLVVGSDRAAITASFAGTFAGTGDRVAVMQDEECDLTSQSAICKEPLFGTTITVPYRHCFRGSSMSCRPVSQAPHPPHPIRRRDQQHLSTACWLALCSWHLVWFEILGGSSLSGIWHSAKPCCLAALWIFATNYD